MQAQQKLMPNRQGRNLSKKSSLALPQIPEKIYFTIGEVSKLCLLEPYVLRYWEQEFPQLSPAKRCGNRRYYKRDEIVLIRRIKSLLYEEGYTIEGARIKLNSDKHTPSPASSQSIEVVKRVIMSLKEILAELED
jgi:DNA-binding transcriptional MerR regulator